MNFDVGRNKKVKVAANLSTDVESTHTARAQGGMFFEAVNAMAFAAKDIVHDASFSHDMKAQTVAMTGTSFDWNVGGSLRIDCSGNNFEVRAMNIALTGTNDVHLHGDEEMRMTGANIDVLANGGDIRMTAAASMWQTAGGFHAVEASGSASINSKQGIQFTAEKTLSAWSMSDIKLQGGSASGKISIADKIFTKASEIHLNGDDPGSPEKAYADIDKAKEALPAQPATGAAGAATAGGGTEYAQLLKANYTFPNDQGGGLSKMALSVQPTSVKENVSPATWHQANTDGDNPLVIRGGKNFTVKTQTDFDKVPGHLGGGSQEGEGRTRYASIRSGTGHLPNLAKSRTAEPLNKMNMPPFPTDWTKDQEFLSKASKVAGTMGISRNELLAIMFLETKRTMSPSINEVGHRTGLIQMGEDEAKSVGTSTKKMKNMTRSEQMDYVEKYFQKNFKGQVQGIAGAYLAVISPNRKIRDNEQEIYERGSPEWSHNREWWDKKTRKVTVNSITERLRQYEKEVEAALGSGQNNDANKAGQGPQPSNSTTNPRSAPPPSFLPLISPRSSLNPSTSGTNKPFPDSGIKV